MCVYYSAYSAVGFNCGLILIIIFILKIFSADHGKNSLSLLTHTQTYMYGSGALKNYLIEMVVLSTLVTHKVYFGREVRKCHLLSIHA